MTDTDTNTETDALQRLRDVRFSIERAYNDYMDSLDLEYAVEADTNTATGSYTADAAHRLIDILTSAVDAWQAERDARETPRTQGSVERALREEWEKYGHGAFKYDGCLLGKLLALDGSYKEFSSGCCTYAADAVGMLLDELGEPQPENASEDPEETQALRELRSAVTRELEVPIDRSKSAIVSALRSRLLPEGCSWPTYEDGTRVAIGDRYVSISGDVRTVEYVTVAIGASALCSHDLEDDVYEPGEHVRRPAPADTWDQLREDATLHPASYCDRHDVNLDQGWEPSDAARAMALDLVRRAQALAGGEDR